MISLSLRTILQQTEIHSGFNISTNINTNIDSIYAYKNLAYTDISRNYLLN